MTRIGLGGLLVVLVFGLPQGQATRADALPRILDVTLDDENRAVVTWAKTGSQGSNNVKWTTDGTLGAPWGDGSYGTPLADCQGGLRPNPARDSQWLYGASCKGDDVPNAATKYVTREEMQVGVYYFQVTVNGNTDHASGRSTGFALHFSGVVKLTVLPADGEEEDAVAEAEVEGTLLQDGKAVTGDVTIRAGKELATRGSPAKIVFRDGSALALAKQSLVQFEQAAGGGQDLFMTRGRIWYSAKAKPRVFIKEVFSLNGVSVLQPRAATFTLHHVRRGVSLLRVYKGTVHAGVHAGYSGSGRGYTRMRVPQGFQLLLVEDRKAPPKPTKLTPEPAFWK